MHVGIDEVSIRRRRPIRERDLRSRTSTHNERVLDPIVVAPWHRIGVSGHEPGWKSRHEFREGILDDLNGFRWDI
ncbi:hypothetical protein C1H46_013477 [Malus baccata]|uniref:Uncharacterized protein n=1 Tax=Malus baccata TaxID=106549 RepID=A0A540MQ77_MALBA|nr:hypothetical protein C1H46_013477 [Malus baccata]